MHVHYNEVSDAPQVHGIDAPRLARWMDERRIGAGPVAEVRLLGGGTQNVVAEFRRGRERYVLRRPPVSGRTDGSATMLREAAVLDALEHTDVPHPRLVAACADESVLGAAFYLMEPVPGVNPATALPEPFVRDAALQRDLGFAMVDTLVALRDVDVSHPLLRDLGRPEGWLERQAPRWLRRLAVTAEIPGYRPLPQARLEALGQWLGAHRPARMRTGLVHGDFHFANVLVDQARPQIVAVVDWELVSIGDPRLDLGHFLAVLGFPPIPGLPDLPGMPGPDEVIQRYQQLTGDTAEADLSWFRVLACLRLTAILEETVGRAVLGHAPAELGKTFRAVTLRLLALAEDVIDMTKGL